MISSDVSGKDKKEIRGLVLARIEALTNRGCCGRSCIADGTFVMIMMPPAVATFVASALFNGKLSVYYDVNGNHLSVQMHELGHK